MIMKMCFRADVAGVGSGVLRAGTRVITVVGVLVLAVCEGELFCEVDGAFPQLVSITTRVRESMVRERMWCWMLCITPPFLQETRMCPMVSSISTGFILITNEQREME